ncbi:MAG: DUF4845 domain-containing protein [Methylophilaceae bacterium]
MHKQNGMSFLGLVIVLAAVLSVVLAGVKIVPAYIEFLSVKKVIKKIANEPSLNDMSKKDIADEFDRGADISYVTVVTGKDLEINKDATGKTVVTVEYQVVKPLAGNLSALMDFKATTAK